MHLSHLLPLAVIAASSPVSPLCKEVDLLLYVARQQSAATAFCSNVLSIPHKTSTSTRTSTIWKASTVTTTTVTAPVLTSTATVATVTTSTSYSTSVSASTVYSTVTSYTGASPQICSPPVPTTTIVDKRDAAATIKPAALSSYPTGSVLKSVCSCLSIPTQTTTVTTVTSVTSTRKLTATSTTTPRTTVTATQTVTSVVPGATVVTTTTTLPTTVLLPSPSAYLIAVGPDGPSDTRFTYARSNGFELLFGQEKSDAATFSYDTSSAQLSLNGETLYSSPANSGEVGPGLQGGVSLPDDYLTCTINVQGDGTCPLTCTAPAPAEGGPFTVNYLISDYYWHLYTSASAPSGYTHPLFTPYFVTPPPPASNGGDSSAPAPEG